MIAARMVARFAGPLPVRLAEPSSPKLTSLRRVGDVVEGWGPPEN